MAVGTKSTAVVKSLGASLAISSVGELYALADMLYKGGASQIPGCGRPEAVAHVILAGAEVGLAPTQALSTIMLVGGKTTVYGDGAMALVLASGLLDEIKEWSEGEGDNLTYFCRVRRKGDQEAVTRSFSVAEAKKADLWEKKDNWKKYPKRMMTMRPRGYAFRDKFADVLKGLQFWEEVVDGGGESAASAPAAAPVQATVISATANVPAPQLPAATVPTAATAPPPAEPVPQPATVQVTATVEPAPITDEQKQDIFNIRMGYLAERGRVEPLTEQQATAAWREFLARYYVKSAAEFTAAQAAEFIATEGPKYDPFRHGAAKTAA